MNFAFDSVSAFFQMGSHGVYVWLCFALTFLILFFNVVSTFFAKKKLTAELEKQKIRLEKQIGNHS